jgi:hypothetical protein
MSRGKAQANNFDVLPTNDTTHFVGIKSGGGTEAELFDMRPLNLVTFDTSATADKQADHVMITIDTGHTTLLNGFIAILNHNLNTCQGKVRIGSSTAEADIIAGGTNMSGCDELVITKVVNADTISTTGIRCFEPGTDGSSIITFPENNDRYFGIQFEGADGDSNIAQGNGDFDGSTDLTVGCILFGEYYDMPHSPDMSVKRSIMFDQASIRESVGGQRYSNMTSHGRQVSATSKSPFSTTTSNLQVFGGRIAYDMNFSYLNATDLLPDEYDTFNATDDSFVEDVWNKTNGSHLPFIFSIDKDSVEDNAESEHIFARFAQNSLDMTQVAPDVLNISLKIEEEF